MLYVCVRGVIDVVFSVCIVTRGALGDRVFLGVVVMLLNVVEVLRVGGGALLDRMCMVFQRMCVLCL